MFRIAGNGHKLDGQICGVLDSLFILNVMETLTYRIVFPLLPMGALKDIQLIKNLLAYGITFIVDHC